VLHIAVRAHCAGPSGFSFELIMTVSDESCRPRVPFRRSDGDAACVAGCCIPAKAGNVEAAAEAAPRIRMNDLRETPCVIVEFIKVLLDKV
jgi:hypothetical protein